MKKTLLFVSALFLSAIGTLNAQTYFSEDFEGTAGTAIPATWTQTTLATDGGWKSGTALGSSGFAIAAHTRYLATNDDACNCNKSNDFIHTPAFSLVGSTTPVLKYDLQYFNGNYGGSQEIGTVEVSTDGGTTWTVVESFGGVGPWVNHSNILSAYAGAASVMIGWRYNDGSGWEYGMALDNVAVIEPPAKETSLTSIVMNKYVLAGNQNVTAVLQSMGGATVTSATLKYNVDGGAAVSQTFAPGIGYGASFNASFTTPATLAVGLHSVKAWISDINLTGPDATPLNDTATFQITVEAVQPVKSVLVEEFTGAWCGYCPRGGVTLSAITAADPKIIGVAIHGGGTAATEAMMIPEGTTVINAYASGFPTGMVDRAYVPAASDYAIDDSQWGATATARESDIVPATVALSAVSFNIATRVVTATVTATFVGAVKGEYALNCYLTENNVYGPLGVTTDNGWNQHNYYYDGTVDASSPFVGVGLTTAPWSTSVAGMMPTDYVHNHVLDKMIGGSYGDNTVVPTTLVAAGTPFTKTFSYTLPAANPGGAHRFNPDNIYVIGVVQEYSSPFTKPNSTILNVTEQKLNSNPEDVLSVNDIQKGSFGSVAVYPNPANESANVAIELNNDENVVISVYNSIGQMVYSESHSDLNAGSHLFSFSAQNLANGIYNVVVNTGKGSITKKVVISK